MGYKIPSYVSRGRMDTPRLPRANARQLADEGGGIEAVALAGLGQDIQQAGGILGHAQTRKQWAIDDTSIATAVNRLNEYTFGKRTELETRVFEDAESFAKAEEEYKTGRETELNRISTGHNERVTARIKQYAINSEIRDKQSYHDDVFRKQQEFNMAEFTRLWGKKFEQFEGAELKGELQLLVKQYEGWMNPTFAQKIEASIDGEIAKYETETFLNAVHEQAKQMPYREAIEFLNDLEVPKAERNDLISRRERQNRIETAITDQPVFNKLWNKSLDIWRGAATKEEFEVELEKALSAGQLDEGAYTSLVKSAASTLKASQAEALNRADTEAGRLIVDVRDDLSFQAIIARLTPDESKRFIDKRQLQFDHLARYNKEMRDWITEHPDKLGKDFYQYSEMLKHQYWNTSIKELKERKLERERELAGSKTVTMVSPEGKRYSVPTGKKQMFIDNGYMEE